MRNSQRLNFQFFLPIVLLRLLENVFILFIFSIEMNILLSSKMPTIAFVTSHSILLNTSYVVTSAESFIVVVIGNRWETFSPHRSSTRRKSHPAMAVDKTELNFEDVNWSNFYGTLMLLILLLILESHLIKLFCLG